MNKVIVISGTTKGLGKDILIALCKNTEYHIATINRSVEDDELDYFLQCRGDISCYVDVLKFYNKIFWKWGKVDVLINNAAIKGLFQPIVKYLEEEIDEIIDTNLKGSFYMTQEAIKLMLDGGFILNIGSTRAITGAPDKAVYSMTKFGLRGLTQCINAELNESNIRSTIVCPGRLDNIQEEVVDCILFLIENNIRNIPEIIIGGKL